VKSLPTTAGKSPYVFRSPSTRIIAITDSTAPWE
jgi:hypothetical protein